MADLVGFSSSEDHDTEFLKRYNKIITDEDDVYILGDLMLNNNEHGLNILNQLNGKIHIILGNHDTTTREELYRGCRNVVEICLSKILKIGKQYYFLCHYPTITANYDDKPYKQHLINLHGHTHFKEKFYNDNPFMYNVALDAHNCYPVSIEQIDMDIHEYIQELYKEQQHSKREYYENSLEYFERHPLGMEILD